jgi:NADPH2:quinone reductase
MITQRISDEIGLNWRTNSDSVPLTEHLRTFPMSTLENGFKALVSSLADSPLDGIENSVSIEVQVAPNPADLSPDEVLIAIRSAGLSWVDLLMTSGQYQHMPTLPYTPGMEFAGDVIAVGSDSNSKWLNRPVFVDCFSVGPRSDGAYQHAGGFASYAVVPESVLRPIPPNWTYDQACNFAGN